MQAEKKASCFRCVLSSGKLLTKGEEIIVQLSYRQHLFCLIALHNLAYLLVVLFGIEMAFTNATAQE